MTVDCKVVDASRYSPSDLDDIPYVTAVNSNECRMVDISSIKNVLTSAVLRAYNMCKPRHTPDIKHIIFVY